MNIQSKLAELFDLEAINPNKAIEGFQQLLDSADKEEDIQEICFHYGLFLHRYGVEDLALELLQTAYALPARKDEIMKILLADFWEPNRSEMETAYRENRKKSGMRFPEFNALPYRLFAVSDEQFLIYNIKEDVFAGWVSISEDSRTGNIKKEAESFSGVLIDICDRKIQEVLQYCYLNADRKIYILDAEQVWTTLYMIPDIYEIYLKNTVHFSDLDMMQDYFQDSAIYLPRIFYFCDEEKKRKVKQILWKEHERRISTKKSRVCQPLLTIGIPSYNRGSRAWALVKALLELPYDSEIEILVSNNGSDVSVEGYEQIRNCQDSRVTYCAFEKNTRFFGNVAQVGRMASGRWLMYVSDEDSVNTKYLNHYMSKLLEYDALVSVIRPNSTEMYKGYRDLYANRGVAALDEFALRNNYISGATYNRRYLTNDLIDRLEERYIANIAYCYYVHMIYDWYMCIMGDFYRYGQELIIEGESEPVFMDNDFSLSVNSFQSRIEQFHAYKAILNDMENIDDEKRWVIYFLICSKTSSLVSARRRAYEKQGISWEYCCSQMEKLFKEEYQTLLIDDEIREWNRDSLYEGIRKMCRSESE